MTKKELISLLDEAISKVNQLSQTMSRISSEAKEKIAEKQKKAA